MKLHDQRSTNLKALIAKHGASKLAAKLGHSGPSYLSQLTSGNRPITEKAARKIEEGLNLEPGWMDVSHNAHEGALDSDLIRKVMEQVTAGANAVGGSVTNGQIAGLVTLLYEDAVKRGPHPDAFVFGIVRLLTVR